MGVVKWKEKYAWMEVYKGRVNLIFYSSKSIGSI